MRWSGLTLNKGNMANVIVRCPSCGHQFIKKSPRSGLLGGAIGAAVATAAGVSVTIGSAGLAAPVVGGLAGMALTHRGSTCDCPKCGAECTIPDE